MFAFFDACSNPCGSGEEEPPPPPVPPSEPQPEVPAYRYMLGTSNGSGISSWSTILGGMSPAVKMRTGDVTGDGKADIVTVESESLGGKYRYMLGTSSGSGVSSWSGVLSGMSDAKEMSLGDVTGDGKADIVTVESEGGLSGTYRYMLGTSSGTGISNWGQILGGMSSPKRMSVGDVTGDGKADIVAVESEGSSKYRYMLGTSNGSGISSWKQILSGMSEAKEMYLGDVTGDGKADIVAVESEGLFSGKYRYMLGTSSGSGVSSWKQILSGMSNPKSVSVGDVTGDGKADIVAVESEGSSTYRYMLGTSSGSGVSSWKQILSGMSEARPMSLGDVTGDGKADAVSVEEE